MRNRTKLPIHPLRAKVLDEIHARPFEPVRAPAVILRYIFWHNEEINHFDVLTQWCKARDFDPPNPGERRHLWLDGKAELTVEMHTEFASISWMGHPDHVPEADPFSVFGDPAPVLGNLINAIRINVRPFDETSKANPKDEQGSSGELDLHNFDQSSLCVSKAEGDKAIIATDFRQNEFGLTQFLVIDLGMHAISCGALTRRIAEIETYRAVALLGLPEAQRLSPAIGKLERQLSEIFTELNTVKSTDENQALLNRLYRIAMDLEAMMIGSQYRFSASRAYNGIVDQRLEALNERQHLGYNTFKVFLRRRISPAMQTCQAIEHRQDALADKISRASDLLRTQLDLDLQSQNQNLLKALNERSELQYRLQQTVEGLSVVAISYYAVSLLYYLYRGVAHPFGLPVNLLVSLSIPFVVLAVWFAIRRVKKGSSKHKK